MSRIIEITDFSDPALDVYARLTENQLVCRADPAEGLFIAESPNVIERALDAGYTPVSLLLERRHIEGQAAHIVARCPGLPIYTAPLPVLTELTGFPLTRGVLCAMRRRPLLSLSEAVQKAARVVVLENIMNPTNLGAIFRSAAALGMDAVLLTHGCADPLYRRAVRVSMGTVFQIPWAFLGETPDDWPHPGLEQLRAGLSDRRHGARRPGDLRRGPAAGAGGTARHRARHRGRRSGTADGRRLRLDREDPDVPRRRFAERRRRRRRRLLAARPPSSGKSGIVEQRRRGGHWPPSIRSGR